MTDAITQSTHDGWYVYIAECTDNTYYTGVIQNITEVSQDAGYIRNRQLKSVPWCRKVASRSTAMVLQTHIRHLSRGLKEYIIDNELECERILSLSKQVHS